LVKTNKSLGHVTLDYTAHVYRMSTAHLVTFWLPVGAKAWWWKDGKRMVPKLRTRVEWRTKNEGTVIIIESGLGPYVILFMCAFVLNILSTCGVIMNYREW